MAGTLLCGCRNASKYSDDIYKVLKPKRLPRINVKSLPKDCPHCDGGYYWYNGYQYECSFCGGDGWQ